MSKPNQQSSATDKSEPKVAKSKRASQGKEIEGSQRTLCDDRDTPRRVRSVVLHAVPPGLLSAIGFAEDWKDLKCLSIAS